MEINKENFARHIAKKLETIISNTIEILHKDNFYFSQGGPVEKLNYLYRKVIFEDFDNDEKVELFKNKEFNDIISELENSVTNYEKIVNEIITDLKNLKDVYSEEYNKIK